MCGSSRGYVGSSKLLPISNDFLSKRSSNLILQITI